MLCQYKIIQLWQCYYGIISMFYGSAGCICSNYLSESLKLPNKQWHFVIEKATENSKDICEFCRVVHDKYAMYVTVWNIVIGIPTFCLSQSRDLYILNVLLLHFLSLNWQSFGRWLSSIRTQTAVTWLIHTLYEAHKLIKIQYVCSQKRSHLQYSRCTLCQTETHSGTLF